MSSSENKTGKAVIKSGCICVSNQLGDLTANSILPLFFFWLWLLLVDSCENHTKRLREHKGPKQPFPSMSLCISPSWTSIFKPDVGWIDTFHCYQWPSPTEKLKLMAWANKIHWIGREKKKTNRQETMMLQLLLLNMQYNQVNCYEWSSPGWTNRVCYILPSLLLMSRCLNKAVLDYFWWTEIISHCGPLYVVGFSLPYLL